MKYEQSKKHFINPYNFVSVNLEETKHFNIEEMNQEKTTQEFSKLRTGYLTCRMKCRTPLAIPDTHNKKETDCKDHYKYLFMGMKEEILQESGERQKANTRLTGEPEIPGSSIRGVIRNIYETITDSCFGTMRADTKITARINKAFKPGLLILDKNGWNLYAAKKHNLVADSAFYAKHKMQEKDIIEFDAEQWKGRNGAKVWFKTITYETKTDRKTGEIREKKCVQDFAIEKRADLKCEGYLCIGEENENRHFHGIFTQGNKVRAVTEKEIERLEYTLEIYRNEKINKLYKEKHSGYPEYARMKGNKVIPVYYDIYNKEVSSDKKKNNGKKEAKNKRKEMSDGILYLSFAALGRKTYEITLNEKAGQKSHQICNDRNKLCAACSLFGTIEGQGMGSRIRFTDAKCDNFSINNLRRNVVFEELGSPRISYVPFYLFSGDKDADYKNGYDSDELQMRGRKFYWHHQPDMSSQNEIEKTERNGTFDVLLPETEFEFKIYFERITERQLETLAVAVHLNENDIKGIRCHKMGHGKPLGYGSVKMTVNECRIRKYDVENGWSEKKDDELLRKISFSNLYDDKNWDNDSTNLKEKDSVQRCRQSTWEDLIKISKFHEIVDDGETKIEYPEIIYEGDKEKLKDKNDLAGHQWYTRNYKLGASRPEQPFHRLSEEEQSLKKYLGVKTYVARLEAQKGNMQPKMEL